MNPILYSLLIYAIPFAFLIAAAVWKKTWLRTGYFVSIFLIFAYRYGIGRDYQSYLELADRGSIFGSGLFNEPIQELLVFLSSQAGMPKLFILLTSLMAVLLLYGFYHQRRHQKSIDVMLAGLYLAPMALVMTTTRQAIGVLVLMLGIKLLEDEKLSLRKLLVFIGVILLAVLNHLSMLLALIFPLLWLFAKWQFKFKYTAASLLGFLLIKFLVPIGTLLTSIGPLQRYQRYLNFNFRLFFFDNDLILLIVLLSAGLLFDFITRDKDLPHVLRLYTTFLWVGLMVPFYINPFLARISLMFSFSAALAIGYGVEYWRKVKRPAILIGPIVIGMVFLLLFGIFYTFYFESAVPYNADTYQVINSQVPADYKLKLMELTDLSVRSYLLGGGR
jgi:hypothetical protein